MSEKKAASYTRTSQGGSQSKDAQDEAIRRYGQEKGWDIAKEYDDPETSGATADRPRFQKMIEDALSAEKPFSAIIVYDTSRFSRNADDLVRYKKLLEDAGVDLLSTDDTSEEPAE